MPFDLETLDDLDAGYLSYLVDERSADIAAHYARLWDYFRNPIRPATGLAADALNANSRPYFQAQEVGLPARITGVHRAGIRHEHLTDLRRKEVVIENDIAWRVHTLVDFLFGKPVKIRSLAEDRRLADAIEQVIAAFLDANGGVSLLQEIALLGSVYGFVDVALRAPAGAAANLPPSHSPLPSFRPSFSRPPQAAAPSDSQRQGSHNGNPSSPSQDGQRGPAGDRPRLDLSPALAAAEMLHLEAVEAPRVLPILDEDDYRQLRYWVQRFHKQPARLAEPKRSWRSPFRRSRSGSEATVEVVEIIGPQWWQRYEDRALVAEGPNALGRLPIVHIQNIAAPGTYEGLGEVEPLVPLQDELNTRLSDRANRVTYQSFKMYLGKGIDDFLERPVAPGQMWATHNMDAAIEEFGSDDGSPSEEAHIEQVRQAMDKISGVTPLAAGLIRGNTGNLTSATALKVVLSGLLSRTAKKRLTYGAGLKQIISLALDWLDRRGVLPTAPRDRRVEIHWPDPLPEDEAQKLHNAQIKAQLGAPRETLLAELGYKVDTLDGSDE